MMTSRRSSAAVLSVALRDHVRVAAVAQNPANAGAFKTKPRELPRGASVNCAATSRLMAKEEWLLVRPAPPTKFSGSRAEVQLVISKIPQAGRGFAPRRREAPKNATPGLMAHPNAPLSPNLVGLPRRPTLARFLDFWLAHIAWQQLRFTTARTYASVVVHIVCPTLGRIAVSRLGSDDIERAQLVWQRAGVKTSMRRKAIEVLRSALRHAVALGLCELNAASRSRVPPKGVRLPAWLEADDARRLLRSARGHSLEAGYALAVGLGLRRGEILGLTWSDVDLRRHVIHVRWNRTEFVNGTRLTEPKTAASRRTLALPAFVERILRVQRERERQKARRQGATLKLEEPVLTTRTRHPYWTSYLHVELQKRLRSLGLPRMRYHDLRHTASALMLGEGVPPRTVMEMMGHRNLEVTMFVYGHVSLRHQHAAARIVDQVLTRRPRGRRKRRI